MAQTLLSYCRRCYLGLQQASPSPWGQAPHPSIPGRGLLPSLRQTTAVPWSPAAGSPWPPSWSSHRVPQSPLPSSLDVTCTNST